MYAAQAAGCAPVVRALEAGLEYPEPVRPDTIAKSIAIGNPADGYQVIQSVRATGGTGAAVTDAQIVDAIRLLAETEGIFTEPAGGTTLAAAIDLDQPRHHSARRIDCRLRHRQRLQDGGSGDRNVDGTGSAEPVVQGFRSVVGIGAGAGEGGRAGLTIVTARVSSRRSAA